jgi:glucosamine-6-phosphate deaminase
MVERPASAQAFHNICPYQVSYTAQLKSRMWFKSHEGVAFKMKISPIRSETVDRMAVYVFDSNEKLGQRAAEDFVVLVSRIIEQQGIANVILATGNSQLTFLSALRVQTGIHWEKVNVFHMDEYLGMSELNPASLARTIREKFVDFVHPYGFYPILGDSSSIESELKRYADLLREFPPDVCVLGIGENTHLGFNDPPADFQTKEVIHVVDLDLKCRMQQVGEGHFQTLDDVPRHAITLTVPALLSAKYVLAVVPEARKATAVRAALKGPVTPNCPASILRTQPHVTMYLDRDSASLL